jgi:hypothetical protein
MNESTHPRHVNSTDDADYGPIITSDERRAIGELFNNLSDQEKREANSRYAAWTAEALVRVRSDIKEKQERFTGKPVQELDDREDDYQADPSTPRRLPIYTYTDRDGTPLVKVRQLPEGSSARFLPFHKDNKGKFVKGWGKRRVLFNLPALHSDTITHVILVEGEKTASRLQTYLDTPNPLFPGTVVTTVPQGSNGPKSDLVEWGVIVRRGLRITLWRDADDGGIKWERIIYERLAELYDEAEINLDINFVVPPAGQKVGWDAADAIRAEMDVEIKNLLTEPLNAPAWKKATKYASTGVNTFVLAERLVADLAPLLVVRKEFYRWNDNASVWYVCDPDEIMDEIRRVLGREATSRLAEPIYA